MINSLSPNGSICISHAPTATIKSSEIQMESFVLHYPLYLSPLRKIPGPPVNNFILAHFASFLNQAVGDAHDYLAKKYGGIARYHGLFNKPHISISDPKLVQQVLEMVPTFVQAGHKLRDIWIKQIGNKKEERITIIAIIQKITLDVIGLVDSELAKAYRTLFGVKENESLPVYEQLTHEELVSQVVILLAAGHETTSTALSWALYFLAKYPDIQDCLRKEVLDVFTDRNHFPTIDEIDQLKYLECIFKETLRIVPPVPLLRRYNLKDEIMNGHVIPKGTPLMISIYARGDDAENFNPSRWLDPEIKSKISNTHFLPFSAGPKNCLGMKMAHFELKSILSVIIRNFEFRLVEGFTFKKKLSGFAKPIPGIDLFVSKVDY
ncbi:cytochrome P450 [Gigaspora margarita]|uniref:Cytochrome P450 n=1 Tax=Gigaspora margarita TaxID=4874 RepID=A0A8H4A180_GIGMA|nr:cytochrome P450 [Gigaspora margarita]